MKIICFIGHRMIEEFTLDIGLLQYTIIDYIENKGVDTFLFGSASKFDDICYEVVTKLKQKYPHIKRIYVRAEYPIISEEYKEYLLQSYEDTYFVERCKKSGRATYIIRNKEMIEKADYCLIYYNDKYVIKDNRKACPITKNSGTKKAYAYIKQFNKECINFYNLKKAY